MAVLQKARRRMVINTAIHKAGTRSTSAVVHRLAKNQSQIIQEAANLSDSVQFVTKQMKLEGIVYRAVREFHRLRTVRAIPGVPTVIAFRASHTKDRYLPPLPQNNAVIEFDRQSSWNVIGFIG